jgi:hypothetical protein
MRISKHVDTGLVNTKRSLICTDVDSNEPTFAAMLYNRADWSRPVPRPIIIPTVMTIATLADVRALVEKHLLAE